MQQTDFPYEICIGEDESTDSTRAICTEYAEKYPDKIRLFLHSRAAPERDAYAAQGNYNFYETSRQCVGKYLATCEGDDKWTDPHKLQKQVALMEANPALVLVHSDFDKLDVPTGKYTPSAFKKRGVIHRIDPDRSRFMYDLIQLAYPVIPCTVLMRRAALMNVYDRALNLFQQLPMGDIPKWCELSTLGTFHFMEESTAMYRALEESVSNTQSPARMFQFVNAASNVGLMLSQNYELPIDLIRATKVKNSTAMRCSAATVKKLPGCTPTKPFHFACRNN